MSWMNSKAITLYSLCIHCACEEVSCKKRDDEDNSVDGETDAFLDDDDSDKELSLDTEDELADDFSMTFTHNKPNSTKFETYVWEQWNLRRSCLGHDYAIAAWMLSPCPEIQHQVMKRMLSDDKEACNNLLAKLFVPQTLEKEETNAFLAKIEDEF